MWLSPSALFESMAASVPPHDDEAIEAVLAVSRANRIQWVVADRTLLMSTTGSEWSVGTVDEPLTPSKIGFTRQGGRGSEAIPPLETGDNILFVQRGGTTIRESSYEFAGDKYQSPDLSIIASHLFAGKKIVNWCYQLNPHSIVWVLLDDGTFLGLTYIREHEVVGWHRHATGGFVKDPETGEDTKVRAGFVEDICCVPGVGYDRVFMVVRRELEGGMRRTIERMGDYFLESGELEDAFFLDSGVTYTGAATDTLTDIAPHLAGETVKIWADGAEQAPKVVGETGTVILDVAASIVHLGLSMVSDVVPNRPEVAAADGTTVTKNYKVNMANINLHNSVGVKAGASEADLEEIQMHDAGDPLVPRKTSGVVEVVVDTGWDDEWNFLMRADSPGPMTVLAVVYDVEISEKP
jgi:hypothetical protein